MSEPLEAKFEDLEIFTKEQLGSGAFGTVYKAKFCEVTCAAKILHQLLCQLSGADSQVTQSRFKQECEILKDIKHPNVVQYLGVTHDQQSGLPILLMELLDENLTDFLKRSDEPLRYHLQVNLWHDIALALTYLHSKDIIHRDLSGKNVLLIAGSRAKVADFGMSKLTVVNAYLTQGGLAQCPGTPCYMSPEALMKPPAYSYKLDVFSSGVVAIQIITREFPEPGPETLKHDNPKSPTGFSYTPISEVNRRKNHIDLIDPEHPLLPLIKKCLADKEEDRPSAQKLCHELALLKQASKYTESKQQPTLQELKVQELRQKNEELLRAQNDHEQMIEELQQKTEELQGELQRALEGQHLQELKIKELQSEVKKYQDQRYLIEQLPPAFVERFTVEALPHQMKKHIEEDLLEWEENLRKFSLFCEHPRSGALTERNLELHSSLTLKEATERAYEAFPTIKLLITSGNQKLKVLELQRYGVQLEWCQLVRYENRALRKPFDEAKEMTLSEVVGGPQSCPTFDLFMEIQIDPATLPWHEQMMRAARVIHTNYSLIWEHLSAGIVLPKLSFLSESQKEEVESYQERVGQNAVIINTLLGASVKHTPDGLLILCETLQTIPGREHIAQRILEDYKQRPCAMRVSPSLPAGNAPLLTEDSLNFRKVQEDVKDLLVQCPNALDRLKQCLASLVLPLGDGKFAPLVDHAAFEAAKTIPEFFDLMSPYWNCLSTNLLSLLIGTSGCEPAAVKLAEFEEARASSGHLVLCANKAPKNELRSVHNLPLRKLQSLYPAVFTKTERNATRITAEICKPQLEVGKPQLHVSCYEDITTAICGFFRLPKAALVYAGCSEKPLALCWLVSRDILPYMRSHKGVSGDRLLAEQQITQIAFGDAEFHKCLNLKEVELHEATFYGLLEQIPALLTSVNVDAAGSDKWTALHYASQEGHYKIVDLLLQEGASVKQETKDGQTALSIATECGHNEIVDLLKKAKKPSWFETHVLNKFRKSAKNKKEDEDPGWTSEVLEGFHF